MKATTKQTAVEWLFEQMPKKLHSHYKKQLDQAKTMEREQISQAYVYGSAYGIDLENGLNPNNYFKEKYESNA